MGTHGGSSGVGFVDNAITAIQTEEKMKKFRSNNVTCMNCGNAEFEELVLESDEHEFISEQPIRRLYDLRVICAHNKIGSLKLSCPNGVKSGDHGRCDRCRHVNRVIDVKRSEKTRGAHSSITIKTKLYHCANLGRDEYCLPYFHCDKFDAFGE